MCFSTGVGFDKSSFYFLTDKKAHTGKLLNNVTGTLHDDYLCNQERYDNISNYFITLISENVNEHIVINIEDYSFGSKGKVFNLAENCGLLKHKLWGLGYKLTLIPPTTLKKFATTKGNANKESMYQSFIAAGNPDINKTLFPTKSKIDNPVSDIVDSYYLAIYPVS